MADDQLRPKFSIVVAYVVFRQFVNTPIYVMLRYIHHLRALASFAS